VPQPPARELEQVHEDEHAGDVEQDARHDGPDRGPVAIDHLGAEPPVQSGSRTANDWPSGTWSGQVTLAPLASTP
jgi:hypothetical protein